MSKTRETRIQLRASPDQVVQALTSGAFLVERDEAQGALSVTVSELSRAGGALVLRVATRRHAHGLTGVDERKIERAEITYRWDLQSPSRHMARLPRGYSARLPAAGRSDGPRGLPAG